MTSCGVAATDIANSGKELALIVKSSDASYHLSYTAVAGGLSTPITYDPSFAESAPWFSPSGSEVVFARVGSQSTSVSAGIWTINVDGTELTILSTDGSSPRWIP
jgi:Tol biopolymer transport system component